MGWDSKTPTDHLMNVRTRVDLARLLHQKRENLEFRRPEPQFYTVADDQLLQREEFKVTDAENIGSRSAKLNGHTGKQLAWVIGLDEVIVGPEIEKFDLFGNRVVGCENKHADAGGAFESDEHFAAVAVREVEIEDDQVRNMFSGKQSAPRIAFDVCWMLVFRPLSSNLSGSQPGVHYLSVIR